MQGEEEVVEVAAVGRTNGFVDCRATHPMGSGTPTETGSGRLPMGKKKNAK